MQAGSDLMSAASLVGAIRLPETGCTAMGERWGHECPGARFMDKYTYSFLFSYTSVDLLIDMRNVHRRRSEVGKGDKESLSWLFSDFVNSFKLFWLLWSIQQPFEPDGHLVATLSAPWCACEQLWAPTALPRSWHIPESPRGFNPSLKSYLCDTSSGGVNPPPPLPTNLTAAAMGSGSCGTRVQTPPVLVATTDFLEPDNRWGLGIW